MNVQLPFETVGGNPSRAHRTSVGQVMETVLFEARVIWRTNSALFTGFENVIDVMDAEALTVSHWQVNASASITSMTFSNPVNNAEFVLQITRASNSTVSITWPTDVRWARDGLPPTVSNGNWTFIGFRYDGTDSTWKEM